MGLKHLINTDQRLRSSFNTRTVDSKKPKPDSIDIPVDVGLVSQEVVQRLEGFDLREIGKRHGLWSCEKKKRNFVCGQKGREKKNFNAAVKRFSWTVLGSRARPSV